MTFPAQFELSGLDNTTGLVINGTVENSRSGSSVSSAGDVNGDGLDDILIEGDQSYVVFGHGEDRNKSSIDLSQLDGRDGFAINNSSRGRNAGDVNNDGFDDIVIRGSDATYLVLGAREWASQIELEQPNSHDGIVLLMETPIEGDVSGAGDVNGDGFDDVIISVASTFPDFSFSAGKSYVLFGNSEGFAPQFDLSSLDGSNGFAIIGVDLGDISGRSVSGAGDVNGDGFDDVIIGAPNADPNGAMSAGESYVIFGSDHGFDPELKLSDLNGANGFKLNGVDELSFSGASVSGGDLNGDGLSDLIIGAPDVGGELNPTFNVRTNSTGASYVVFGQRNEFASSLDLSSLDGTNGFIFKGVPESGKFGGAVSNAGDINGDSIDDLIVGAWAASSNNLFRRGRSFVLFGSRNGFNAEVEVSSLNGTNGFALNGINEGDWSGWSVSGAGDINGDRLNDLIIGANRASPNGNMFSGESYVILGQEFVPGPDERLIGTRSNDTLKGGVGNDTILGLAGDDILQGSRGDDRLRGLGGDDKLIGGSGNDYLVGGGDNDRLVGGRGFDSLRGGLGADQFVFLAVENQPDRILDFDPREDSIFIRKSGFDLDIPTGRLTHARLTIGATASDKNDRFIYDKQIGALLFDADGSRSQEAQVIAVFNQRLELSAANIRII